MVDALVERPASRSCRARGELRVVKVRADAWLELLEDSFELSRTLIEHLVDAVAMLEERAWASGSSSLVELVAPAPRSDEPLDVVDRLALLLRVVPLRDTGVQPVSDLAVASQELTFRKGEHLFEPGSAPDRVMLLVEGSVDAFRRAPDVSCRRSGGQLVCGLAAFGPRRAHWSAVARTPVRALAFGVEDWFDLMEENFDMVRRTLAALALERERLSGAR
jgi:CRP-like cAMP-binding protein